MICKFEIHGTDLHMTAIDKTQIKSGHAISFTFHGDNGIWDIIKNPSITGDHWAIFPENISLGHQIENMSYYDL